MHVSPTVPLGFVPPNLNFDSSFPMSSVIDMLARGLSSSPLTSVNLLVKLDDNNHMIWQDQIMKYVIAYGLEGILDGFLTCLNFTFPNSILLN